METQYDIFEVLLNRTVKWHRCVLGKQGALYMLKDVSFHTSNECFAIDLETREILTRMNGCNVAGKVRIAGVEVAAS